MGLLLQVALNTGALGSGRHGKEPLFKTEFATAVTGVLLSIALFASPTLAAEMCDKNVVVYGNGHADSDFMGRILELYEDEGGGDPKKYRHLYLFLPESICFTSKDEDRAAALNMIQLYPIDRIPNALLKASVVTVKGRAIAVHLGHGFGTPYAIKVVKATVVE